MLQHIYQHANPILKTTKGHVLWIGDLKAAENIGWIKQNQIKTVLTAAAGFTFVYDPTIKHFRHDLEDKKTENISAHFDLAAFQIQKSLRTGSILVHCGAGVSRSSTLVIAYLIKYRGMTFQTALKLCKSKRPQVCPNLGFELQLKAYEKSQGSLNSHPSNHLTVLQKRRQKSELPELQRYSKLNITFQRSSLKPDIKKINTSVHKRQSHQVLQPTTKVQNNQRYKIYLRKIAEFRFGLTNLEKWKIQFAHKKQKD